MCLSCQDEINNMRNYSQKILSEWIANKKEINGGPLTLLLLRLMMLLLLMLMLLLLLLMLHLVLRPQSQFFSSSFVCRTAFSTGHVFISMLVWIHMRTLYLIIVIWNFSRRQTAHVGWSSVVGCFLEEGVAFNWALFIYVYDCTFTFSTLVHALPDSALHMH